MLRRIEAEGRSPSLFQALGLASSEPVVAALAESEQEPSLLPHDHPQWVKDALTVSHRAREAIARLRPAAVRILTFWDHRIRSIAVGGGRLSIDASGSYRLQ
ncbi:MAG TPA: hypothetical protein VGN11_12085 [Candidatus Baltobacteraceae bacterium]|jgi:hypothetical protein|nr:hypothetical protein [Candidatus Baltobacteraceae bacterium]